MSGAGRQERWLTTAEAAAELSRRLGRPVGRPLMTSWATRGYLPAVRVGGRWLVPEGALERLLERQ